MTTSRLLCPIDFSVVSTHALEHAVAIARRRGAGIVALAVLPSLAPDVTDITAVAAETTGPAKGDDDLRRWRGLADAQCRAVDAAGVDLAVEVVEAHPVEAIVDRARTLRADLIVMGTHGAGGFRHFVLGSVTEKVLRRAPCPVLTVPPRAVETASTFAQVLAAVDFSDSSLAAVARATEFAEQAHGRLTLLHVVEWPWHDEPDSVPDGVPEAQAQTLRDYRRYLEHGALERLRTLAPDHSDVSTAVRFGTPWIETLAVAADTRADLIVLGVRGRGPIDLGFFGSTANHVVRAATCPVLTVRS